LAGLIGGVSIQELRRFPVCLPSLSEQKVIADFLDEECGKVDALVADMESQINILRQARKSLITETVTKGLKNTVILKDSGVAWIGKIPQNWGLNKLRFVVTIRTEAGKYTAKDSFMGLENIESNTGKFIETESEYEDGTADIYQKGDVLFSKLRPYLAKAYIAKNNGFCTGEFVTIKGYRGDKRFLFYYFLSHGFLSIVDASTYGTKMPRASWDFIRNLAITVPDDSEQQAIADYLDEECAKIDAIIKDKQAAVDTMCEYKKSLIYEYVTGKKRVREAQ
jgi:restriction endonuclease S subunit